MLRNFINIATRTLMRNKLHSLINVLGLGFGIACVFVIVLYVQRELSYDRFHESAENIYRITWEDNNPQTRTPHPLAQAMRQDFPEVENAVSLTPLFGAGLTRETHSFRNPASDVRYDEKNILAVDTTFFDVFTFPMLRGDPSALRQTDALLISESMAKKYFPGEDAMGKHLAVDGDQQLVEVSGIFKDVPAESHMHFDFLVSYLREKSFDSLNSFYSWADFGHYNYIRLRDGADAKALERKMMPWLRKYIDVSDEQYAAVIDQGFGFRLQPLTDIHLQSRLRWELEPNGNIEYVYLLSAAAFLTLLIACVNFMNLTTAKSAERAKEIGVRKTLGAARKSLTLQFLSESVILASLSVTMAVLITELALPFFSAFADVDLQINYSRQWFILVLLAITIGVISGLYPAAYLSRIKPHLILKGKMTQSREGAGFRNGLILFQFFISMILVSSAFVIYSQLKFLQEKDLGFGKESVMVIAVKDEDGMQGFDALQTELLRIEGVKAASASSNLPGGQFNQHHIASVQHPENEVATSEAFVDYDFFNTLDIKFVEGRGFLRENSADTLNAFVINETAARSIFFEESAVGKELLWKHPDRNIEFRGTVIGVVADFHFQSLHEPIRPILFALSDDSFNHILVRMEGSNVNAMIKDIEDVYKRVEPIYGFEYTFLEDRLDGQYRSEQRTGAILTIFTLVAIIIASFGLFAISLLAFHQRIKEFSVRKVLGASVVGILTLLLGNFTKLILWAILLATPLAWWIMDGWLANFSYQIEISPLIFLVSGLGLVLIAWLTLGYFTIRAAQLNPAETLKSE